MGLVTILCLIWGASEATVFARDLQRGAGQRRDRASRATIFAVMTLAFTIAFNSAHRHIAPLPGAGETWQVTGTAVFAAGILLRQWAVIVLGIYFRTRVTVLDDHRLITAGPYRRVRHPSYAGGLLICTGVGLALTDAGAVAALTLLPPIAFAYRIRVEEAALAGHFGADWTAYHRSTAALVPGVW